MYISDSIVAVVVAFALTELAAFIGFIWKANQLYQRDRDSNREFLNALKLDFEAKYSSIIMGLQKEASTREREQVEYKKEVDAELQKIKYQLDMEKEMSKRSVEELKEQISDLSEKVDRTQESIEIVHRRIDELFKMIQKIKAGAEEQLEVKSTRRTKRD